MLSDLSMPGMDGMQLLEAVRGRSRNAFRPRHRAGRRAHGGPGPQARRVDYCPKPFDNEEIRAIARRAREVLSLRAENRRLREAGRRIPRPSSATRRRCASLPPHPSRGPDRRDGPHHGRERHRQGAGRARDPRATARARDQPVRGAELRRAARRPARERALRPREGRLHRRGPRPRRASSSRRTAARCSSTRSATSAVACRPSSCASLEERKVDAGRHHQSRPSTCGSSPRRTGRSRGGRARRLPRGSSLPAQVVTLRLPPLRERRDDIAALAVHFLADLGEPARPAVRSTRRRRWRALLAYDWPGNVRELRNVLERAVVLADGDAIDVPDLPAHVAARRRAGADRRRGGRPPLRGGPRARRRGVRALLPGRRARAPWRKRLRYGARDRPPPAEPAEDPAPPGHRALSVAPVPLRT